jgi:hypothetical protein
MVRESFEPGKSVSMVAHQYGVKGDEHGVSQTAYNRCRDKNCRARPLFRQLIL